MYKNKAPYLIGFLLMIFSIGKAQVKPIENSNLKLWYNKPATKWTDAFPLGNGKLAAMSFGGTDTERFQMNEESLWAGCPSNPYAEDYKNKLAKVQELLLAGKSSEAAEFGTQNMTASPTSFRSYEPLADLLIKFKPSKEITNYRRELNMETGISKVTYQIDNTSITGESFISAVDNVLCIRYSANGKGTLNCSIGLKRQKDVVIKSAPNGQISLDGQIVDIEAPAAYDDNSGGSGEGGKHMRFAGLLQSKITGGSVKAVDGQLIVSDAKEIFLVFTAATNYNLSILNFDEQINPQAKIAKILTSVKSKSWDQLKVAHTSEHTAMFNKFKIDLGASKNDNLPTDQRLLAYKNGANDPGLTVQLLQFGRYLLIGSSRSSSTLPANLQGKWSERLWAPWEADYHLNINLQMNYWPADVTHMSETFTPLINWFEKLMKGSKPLAQEMYGSDGLFSFHATNPFGRVTPSASTLASQFGNGVIDPLPGAWMTLSLWDHYQFTQDKVFLKERLYPLLKGVSEFISDILITDKNGNIYFAPSSSPENAYKDIKTGEMLRVTVNSTYHLTIIKAVFKATQEAAAILNINDETCRKIAEQEKKLSGFPIDKNGRIKEWVEDVQENEPGHRHLSHLLGVFPFSLITKEGTPEVFEAARKSLEWREQNGHGGMGWAYANALLMHARLLEPEKAYKSIFTLLTRGAKTSMMNTQGPFQIDANLGAVAGVSEMLIQSHLKDKQGNFMINLLPALPQEWANGSVSGICARGGFEINMVWKNGKVDAAAISSKNGGSCTINFNDKKVEVKLKAGETLKLV